MPTLYVIPCGYYARTIDTKEFEKTFKDKVPTKKAVRPKPTPPKKDETAAEKTVREAHNKRLEDEANELDYFHVLAEHLAKEAEWTVVKARTTHQAALKKVMKTGDRELYVFLAPEFFFRGPWQERKRIDAKGKEISLAGGRPFSRTTFTNGLKYLGECLNQDDETLMLPGTIWWADPNQKKLDAATKQPTEFIVHNTLPIFFDKKMVHTWQKFAYSGADDLDSLGAEKWDREFDPKALQGQKPTFELPIKNFSSKLRVGVEICLDHYNEILKKEKKELDLHLLVAAGAVANETRVAMRLPHGVFARIDGFEQRNAFTVAQLTPEELAASKKQFQAKHFVHPQPVKKDAFGQCFVSPKFFPIEMK